MEGFFEKMQNSSKNKWKKVVDEQYAARQGVNYDAFESKFQSLAVISGLKDQCLSLMFKRALNSNTRRAAEEGDPKSVEDCYKLAEDYEACSKVVNNREAAMLTKYFGHVVSILVFLFSCLSFLSSSMIFVLSLSIANSFNTSSFISFVHVSLVDGSLGFSSPIVPAATIKARRNKRPS